MMRNLLIAAALVAAPFAAQAQAKPDAAALTAAHEMMAVTDLQAQMRAVAPRIAEVTNIQMRQAFADQKVPEGLQVKITAAAQSFIGSIDGVFTPALVDQIAEIYAQHFSAAELRRLTTLLKDPAMVKFRAEMPSTMAEIMPLVMTAMRPRQQLFQGQVKQIVTEWMQQHPEDKAKLRTPAAQQPNAQ
jgi:TRAP-type C4-dicarboxylate transport system permease large subunit